MQVENKTGCNGTRVQWQPINTGNCVVEYTIEFRKTNKIVGTEKNIRGNSYCTRDHNNATSVIMWATYEGRQGLISDEKHLTLTPDPTNPTAIITSAASTQKGKIFS